MDGLIPPDQICKKKHRLPGMHSLISHAYFAYVLHSPLAIPHSDVGSEGGESENGFAWKKQKLRYIFHPWRGTIDETDEADDAEFGVGCTRVKRKMGRLERQSTKPTPSNGLVSPLLLTV